MSAFNIFLFIILGVIIVILGYFVYIHYFGEQTNTANSTLWLNNNNVAATNASFTYTKIVNPTSTAYTFSMWLYINSWPTGGNANIFNCKSVAGEKNYLTFFQNDAFSRHATKVKIPRNSNTQTPMRTRVF